ncbi:phenylpyruvate decarboxylase [Candida albicans GC75]|nr:phenylpyruvate decarboxylase [Candida albicans GC75]
MTPIQQTPSVHNTIDDSSNGFPNQISLGEYLFYRISQANPNLKSIFGIPGDFNLNLLEHVYSPIIAEREIKFINTCNELNCAYAADGYSRVIGGMNAMITTFGVGELSAINGIAGAFAEHCPVLHIVGTTSMKDRLRAPNEMINIHHLVPNHDPLKPPNHDVYKSMVENISVVQESLDYDTKKNLIKIDNVLKKIIQEARPGYLFIPCDVPDLPVPGKMLFSDPFTAATRYTNSILSKQVLNDVTNAILEKMYDAKNPSIFSDCLTTRFGFQNDLNRFIDQIPETVKLFTANLARNLDESRNNFVGVYNGNGSSDDKTKQEFESSDFILTLGFFPNEMNTGGHTSNFSMIKDVVIVHADYIKVNHQIYHIKQNDGERLFTLGEFLCTLTEKFDPSKLSVAAAEPKKIYQYQPSQQYSPSNLDYIPQGKLIDHFNTTLKPNDLFILETSSFVFGLPDMKFPTNVQLLTSPYYGSIGYAVPATFGATLAVNDLKSDRRIIVVQGDGSAQMTVQELSSFVRYKEILPNMPHIYLINNDGYTIERKIKGPNRSYNDINGKWKWRNLLNVFGGVEGEMYDSCVLKNSSELDQFFNGDKTKPISSHKLQFYEIIAGKFDVPQRVDNMMCISKNKN